MTSEMRSPTAEKDRHLIVKALLDSDCRYVVSGDATCERWHDEVDSAS
jgi:hypothetical protein